MKTADALRVSLAAQALAGDIRLSDPEKFKAVQEDLADYYERELQFAQAMEDRDGKELYQARRDQRG